jgi:hypothetical protein
LRKGFAKLACPWAFSTVLCAHLCAHKDCKFCTSQRYHTKYTELQAEPRLERSPLLAASRILLGTYTLGKIANVLYACAVYTVFMLTILGSIIVLVEILFYYGPLLVVLLNMLPRLSYMIWQLHRFVKN